MFLLVIPFSGVSFCKFFWLGTAVMLPKWEKHGEAYRRAAPFTLVKKKQTIWMIEKECAPASKET